MAELKEPRLQLRAPTVRRQAQYPVPAPTFSTAWLLEAPPEVERTTCLLVLAQTIPLPARLVQPAPPVAPPLWALAAASFPRPPVSTWFNRESPCQTSPPNSA